MKLHFSNFYPSSLAGKKLNSEFVETGFFFQHRVRPNGANDVIRRIILYKGSRLGRANFCFRRTKKWWGRGRGVRGQRGKIRKYTSSASTKYSFSPWSNDRLLYVPRNFCIEYCDTLFKITPACRRYLLRGVFRIFFGGHFSAHFGRVTGVLRTWKGKEASEKKEKKNWNRKPNEQFVLVVRGGGSGWRVEKVLVQGNFLNGCCSFMWCLLKGNGCSTFLRALFFFSIPPPPITQRDFSWVAPL